MSAARYVAVSILAFGIETALAGPPVALGDPFHVRHGESVELTHGVSLKFIGVTSDGRCPADVTCVWQGEAVVEIELQVQKQSARGSMSTEKTDLTLLAHKVKLLGLYPGPRASERRPAEEYVAFFRVADTAATSAKDLANRAAALDEAVRYVGAYTRAAKSVCADWQQRGLASYSRDSGGLCEMIGKVSRTAYAVNGDADDWRFYFVVDNPWLREQMPEAVYLMVTIYKAPKDAFDQVGHSDVVVLPCDVTLLAPDPVHRGCNWNR
jgi:hypothetical protein